MERPKSAKHNAERSKKSAYANFKRINRALESQAPSGHHQSMYNTGGSDLLPPPNHVNDYDLISITPTANNSNANYAYHHQHGNQQAFVEIADSIVIRQRKEQRFQTSKSAVVGGSIAKLRPQSARHNLEKYRQDVIIEQQRKLQKLQLLQQQQQQQQQVLSVTPNQDLGNVNRLYSSCWICKSMHYIFNI